MNTEIYSELVLYTLKIYTMLSRFRKSTKLIHTSLHTFPRKFISETNKKNDNENNKKKVRSEK